jgi:hypothetical protein
MTTQREQSLRDAFEGDIVTELDAMEEEREEVRESEEDD